MEKELYRNGWSLKDPEEIKKNVISKEILKIDRPNVVAAFSEIVSDEIGMETRRQCTGYTAILKRVIGKAKDINNLYVALDYRDDVGKNLRVIFFDDEEYMKEDDIKGIYVTLMTNAISANIDVEGEHFDQEYEKNERILRYVEQFVEETLKPKVFETNDRIKDEGKLELRDGFGIEVKYNLNAPAGI